MMNNRLLKTVVLLTGSLLLCMPIARAQDVQKDKADLFLYEGHRQAMLGNNSDAFELFRHSLRLNPESASALAELSRCYLYLRNDSLALEYQKRATEYDPDNFWLKESLVEMLSRTGKTDEAIAVLEGMSVQFPGKEDVLMMLEVMYKENGDYRNMIKVLDRLEVKDGKSEAMSMEKFRAYVSLKDSVNAFSEMSDLANEYPNDPRYRVLMGDLYVGQGRYDEGLAVYKEVEKEDPDNVYLMASMLSYYSTTGQDSLYNVQIEKISLNPNLDNETRLRFLNSLVMQNLQEEKNPDHLLEIFKKVLTMQQTDTQIAELCVRFMMTIKSPTDEVKPVLNQMLTINPECEFARDLLMQFAVDENDIQKVIEVCRPAVDCSSDNIAFYYYLGIAYAQADSSHLAIQTLKKGLTKVDDNTNVQVIANMYAILGDTYYTLKDRKHTYENYDSCLMYNPDEALVLNNYAYYLSLENRDLDKAEQMSRRALEKEGDNYTYVDTYAWILFQQRKYAESKVYIDSALVLMDYSLQTPEDSDMLENDSAVYDTVVVDSNIIEHAGDIYAKNGLIDEAMAYWQESYDLGNQSATLQRKLKKKKYVEGKEDIFK